MDPLISIIVPVYNVEQYISQCLDSIICQTYKNIQILCVNDGTKDSSRKIICKYMKQDSRIELIDQENSGLSAARNTGLANVCGKYVMFVDSDDWIDKDTCEIAVKTAEKYTADVVFWCYVREFENEAKEKHFFWDNEHIFNENETKVSLHRRLCGMTDEELKHPDHANAIETAWGKLYLADIAKKHRFVDTKIIGTEDALYNLYVFGDVKKAVYIDRCMNHYRKNNVKSLTSRYNPHLFQRWNNLFDYMQDYIQNENLGFIYCTALNNRIALSLLGLGLNIVNSENRIGWKLKEIKKIVSNERYKKAVKQLDTKHMPIHWKCFYTAAKLRLCLALFILLSSIQQIIG